MRYVIVGGGMSGLALAWFLRGESVAVVEAEPEPGGLSTSSPFPGFTWDRFYHCILPSDLELIALLGELGLAEQIVWTRTSTGFFTGGSIRPLNSALDLLRLPSLSLRAKLRIGLHTLVAPYLRDGAAFDRLTAPQWLQRWCGREGLERFWRPLLRAKLGAAADRVAARFLWETIRRLASARRADGGGERIGYVRGGYRAILGRLRSRLVEHGVEFQVGSQVESVTATGAEVLVRTKDCVVQGDAALLTVPNPVLAAIVPSLDRAVAERMATTPYLGIACTVAVGRSALGENYILNLADERLRLTGVIEMTNLVRGAEETAGRTLVYLPRYALAGDPMFARSDQELAAEALADLRTVHPAADENWLLHHAVHRARLIQPVPLAGAPSVAPPRVLIPGRAFAVNSACLPACPLNNNACVGLARRTAADLPGLVPGRLRVPVGHRSRTAS